MLENYNQYRSKREQKDAVYSSIRNVGIQLNMALIKLMLFPTHEKKDEWMQQAYVAFHWIDKLPSTKDYPKYKLILDALKERNLIADSFIINIIDEFGKPERPHTLAKMIFKLESYQSWLADELSRFGVASRSDVYNKLEELIIK